MNSQAYEELLSSFLTKGFRFIKFEGFCASKNSQLILRHDVDFCIELALQMARLEEKIGVTSTYYFLITSDSYNLLSKKNSESVKCIQNMGHSVGLHFDPTHYIDEQQGFEHELELFENNFGTTKSMSFHRPSQHVLEGVSWLPSRIIGAYQEQYFRSIAYISDSGGEFRFGHPLDHSSFENLQNIQLLIHPIWWMTNESHTIPKIKEFLSGNAEVMSDHVAKNCKPWKKYNE